MIGGTGDLELDSLPIKWKFFIVLEITFEKFAFLLCKSSKLGAKFGKIVEPYR